MEDVKPDGAAIAEQAVNPLAAFAAQPGTLTAQIQITRAGTGKVERVRRAAAVAGVHPDRHAQGELNGPSKPNPGG